MNKEREKLVKELENIDFDIDVAQFNVKCGYETIEKALKDVNFLVEKKRKIVEKLKSLDINI